MDDFDRWCGLKRKLDSAIPSVLVLPKEKEVWMCNLGRNIGYEENGKGSDFLRPVLIFKVFSRQMCWSIPLSTKQKQLFYYYNYREPAGTKASAIIGQLRLTSVRRLTRKLYTMQGPDFSRIKQILLSIIKKIPA